MLLDAACGTGGISCGLALRGYDVTGVDISESALSAAWNKYYNIRDNMTRGNKFACFFARQDIRALSLPYAADAAVCCCDGVNHLLNGNDVSAFFSGVHGNIRDGGLFIFDINSPWKFDNVYAGNAYIIEAYDKVNKKNVLCAWQNRYNKKTGLCRFDISLFVERDSKDRTEMYERFDETFSEKRHDPAFIARLLRECGFAVLGTVVDFAFTPYDKNKYGDGSGMYDDDQKDRIFYITKKV